jgi:hypothetical protein
MRLNEACVRHASVAAWARVITELPLVLLNSRSRLATRPNGRAVVQQASASTAELCGITCAQDDGVLRLSHRRWRQRLRRRRWLREAGGSSLRQRQSERGEPDLRACPRGVAAQPPRAHRAIGRAREDPAAAVARDAMNLQPATPAYHRRWPGLHCDAVRLARWQVAAVASGSSARSGG